MTKDDINFVEVISKWKEESSKNFKHNQLKKMVETLTKKPTDFRPTDFFPRLPESYLASMSQEKTIDIQQLRKQRLEQSCQNATTSTQSQPQTQEKPQTAANESINDDEPSINAPTNRRESTRIDEAPSILCATPRNLSRVNSPRTIFKSRNEANVSQLVLSSASRLRNKPIEIDEYDVVCNFKKGKSKCFASRIEEERELELPNRSASKSALLKSSATKKKTHQQASPSLKEKKKDSEFAKTPVAQPAQQAELRRELELSVKLLNKSGDDEECVEAKEPARVEVEDENEEEQEEEEEIVSASEKKYETSRNKTKSMIRNEARRESTRLAGVSMLGELNDITITPIEEKSNKSKTSNKSIKDSAKQAKAQSKETEMEASLVNKSKPSAKLSISRISGKKIVQESEDEIEEFDFAPKTSTQAEKSFKNKNNIDGNKNLESDNKIEDDESKQSAKLSSSKMSKKKIVSDLEDEIEEFDFTSKTSKQAEKSPKNKNNTSKSNKNVDEDDNHGDDKSKQSAKLSSSKMSRKKMLSGLENEDEEFDFVPKTSKQAEKSPKNKNNTSESSKNADDNLGDDKGKQSAKLSSSRMSRKKTASKSENENEQSDFAPKTSKQSKNSIRKSLKNLEDDNNVDDDKSKPSAKLSSSKMSKKKIVSDLEDEIEEFDFAPKTSKQSKNSISKWIKNPDGDETIADDVFETPVDKLAPSKKNELKSNELERTKNAPNEDQANKPEKKSKSGIVITKISNQVPITEFLNSTKSKPNPEEANTTKKQTPTKLNENQSPVKKPSKIPLPTTQSKTEFAKPVLPIPPTPALSTPQIRKNLAQTQKLIRQQIKENEQNNSQDESDLMAIQSNKFIRKNSFSTSTNKTVNLSASSQTASMQNSSSASLFKSAKELTRQASTGSLANTIPPPPLFNQTPALTKDQSSKMSKAQRNISEENEKLKIYNENQEKNEESDETNVTSKPTSSKGVLKDIKNKTQPKKADKKQRKKSTDAESPKESRPENEKKAKKSKSVKIAPAPAQPSPEPEVTEQKNNKTKRKKNVQVDEPENENAQGLRRSKRAKLDRNCVAVYDYVQVELDGQRIMVQELVGSKPKKDLFENTNFLRKKPRTQTEKLKKEHKKDENEEHAHNSDNFEANSNVNVIEKLLAAQPDSNPENTLMISGLNATSINKSQETILLNNDKNEKVYLFAKNIENRDYEQITPGCYAYIYSESSGILRLDENSITKTLEQDYKVIYRVLKGECMISIDGCVSAHGALDMIQVPRQARYKIKNTSSQNKLYLDFVFI